MIECDISMEQRSRQNKLRVDGELSLRRACGGLDVDDVFFLDGGGRPDEFLGQDAILGIDHEARRVQVEAHRGSESCPVVLATTITSDILVVPITSPPKPVPRCQQPYCRRVAVLGLPRYVSFWFVEYYGRHSVGALGCVVRLVAIFGIVCSFTNACKRSRCGGR